MKANAKRDRKYISSPNIVYHMTDKSNLDSILESGKILADYAGQCFFFPNLDAIPIYIALTGALHGRKTFDKIDGVTTCRTMPPLIIEETVILCLKPRFIANNWSKELILPERYTIKTDAIEAFEECRLMHDGDMKFKASPETIELKDIVTLEKIDEIRKKYNISERGV